jgi:hypothetical protein
MMEYDQTRPSQIVLDIRVQPHAAGPTQVDLSVAGLHTHNLPGGWSVAHDLLLEAARAAHRQAVAPPTVIRASQTPDNGRAVE